MNQAVIVSSPAIASDVTIFNGSGEFNLYALRPDGRLNRSYPTESGITYSPVIGVEGDLCHKS